MMAAAIKAGETSEKMGKLSSNCIHIQYTILYTNTVVFKITKSKKLVR